MADRDEIVALIDRIMSESNIADARDRAELRRELESHFAEAAGSDDSLHEAIEHFGSPSSIGTELASVHSRGPFLTRVMRLGCALAASSCVALALQLVTNVRIGTRGAAFALGGGFSRSLVFSAALIVILVAAWELDIDAFCARLERHPLRMFWIGIILATIMIAFHAFESSTLPPPGLALTASAIDVVIWTCTIAILGRTERAFARVFTVPPSRN
jgi:hypothetical protein